MMCVCVCVLCSEREVLKQTHMKKLDEVKLKEALLRVRVLHVAMPFRAHLMRTDTAQRPEEHQERAQWLPLVYSRSDKGAAALPLKCGSSLTEVLQTIEGLKKEKAQLEMELSRRHTLMARCVQ